MLYMNIKLENEQIEEHYVHIFYTGCSENSVSHLPGTIKNEISLHVWLVF